MKITLREAALITLVIATMLAWWIDSNADYTTSVRAALAQQKRLAAEAKHTP